LTQDKGIVHPKGKIHHHLYTFVGWFSWCGPKKENDVIPAFMKPFHTFQTFQAFSPFKKFSKHVEES